MTNAQELAIRLSKIRQRLNEIAGLPADDVTEEVRAESDGLTAEYQAKETQHRAALVVEADEARAAEGEFGNGDGEPAEVRALMNRITIGALPRTGRGQSAALMGAAVELAGGA